MFWSNDISVLYTKPLDFYPGPTQSTNDKLNSTARLAAYISVTLAIYKKDYRYLGIFIIVLGCTYYLYNTESIKEALRNISPTVPTLDNPFMNATMADYLNTDSNGRIENKESASNPLLPDIKKEMKTNFDAGSKIPRDANDLFDKNGADRQFFTMPSTSIPHDREEFQNWLYKTPDTCKQNGNCLQYEDLRAKRPVFVDQFANPAKN